MSDIVLIVLDATTTVKNLDKKICRLVVSEQKPCVLLANKWDLACKKFKQKDLLEQLRTSLPFLDYVPILTCCALSGYNFNGIIDHVIDLYERLRVNIPTAIVNSVIKNIFARYYPTSAGVKPFKVYYGVHTHSSPPTFLLFVNKVSKCAENDLINIKKQMRRAFGLVGLPIHICLRERE